jgi:hypothetical protein
MALYLGTFNDNILELHNRLLMLTEVSDDLSSEALEIPPISSFYS